MTQITSSTPAMPKLVIGTDDHDRLMSMAYGLSNNDTSDLADKLIGELDRARVVAQTRLPKNAVRIGSTVSFTTSDGFDRTYKLVFPIDADISEGRISILTPIGAALIGLSEGQTIPWTVRNGRQLSLTVLSVEQDERE